MSAVHDGRGRGVFDVPDRTAAQLRIGAIATGLVMLLVLVVAAWTGGMPRNPEGDWFRTVEQPAQAALLTVTAIALALAWRWTGTAAILIALGGVGLAVLSAIAYPPTVAVTVAAGFLLPAVMLWVAWQRHETLGRIALLAIATTSLLIGAWAAADATYQHFFGPAHPSSSTVALDDPLVEWAWSGGVDDHGFSVVVKPTVDTQDVRMTVTTTAGAAVDTVHGVVVDGVARVRVEGLQPGTEYRYRFAAAGAETSAWVGEVRTFGRPADPIRSDDVVIAVSSCARTGSNGQVYDAIRSLEPDLYLITGDMHYSNIARDDVDAFDRAYDTVLTSAAQAALYRSTPVAYVWDDHDFGGNDGDASSPSRPAARASYERNVPSHELVSSTTINQAFSIDGVRLVLLDTRSAREPGKTLLGDEQFAWLQAELLESSPTHDLVIIVSPTPWIGVASDGSDAWAGFADERSQLADFVADQGLSNLMIASGDAHMVAVDDGSNADYSDSGRAAIPVLQAAALDRPGNVKGGPYSEGTFPGAGQFGLIRVARDDGATTVTLEGHRYDGQLLVSWQFTPCSCR